MGLHKLALGLALVLVAVGTARADWIAYQVDGPVNGNQGYGMPLGLDFDVSTRIGILALGAFDDQRNGVISPITVRLWARTGTGNSASGTEIVATGIPATVSGTIPLQAGFAFVDLASPLVLGPGSYTISAEGYGAGDNNGNSNAGDILPRHTDSGGGLISFVQSRYGTAPVAFPANAGEWGSGANLVPGFTFLGPSFRFEQVPEPVSASLFAVSLAFLAARRPRR